MEIFPGQDLKDEDIFRYLETNVFEGFPASTTWPILTNATPTVAGWLLISSCVSQGPIMNILPFLNYHFFVNTVYLSKTGIVKA